jgi:hypothetical protein
MSHFIIEFLKKVLGDNGREDEIRQCSIEVDASNRTEAAELAKGKFCQTQRISEWSDHADRLEVKEVDFTS